MTKVVIRATSTLVERAKFGLQDMIFLTVRTEDLPGKEFRCILPPAAAAELSRQLASLCAGFDLPPQKPPGKSH